MTSNAPARSLTLFLIAVLSLVVPLSIQTAPALAQNATPIPSATTPLSDLLQVAPDVLSGDNPVQAQIADYADIAAQAELVGRPKPTSIDDEAFIPWVFGIAALILPQPLINFSRVADWKTLLGFDLWDLEQTLEAGEPPATVTLLRGDFDQDAIRAAWTAQGYKMLEIDGLPVASLHEDGSFDFDSEIGRYAFARFNNAVLLPDGTLAYAPTLDGLRAVIATAKGTAPSLGDRLDVAALVAAIETPLASALLLTGPSLQTSPVDPTSLLEGTPDIDAIATSMAEIARMPPIAMALLGITPGGKLSQPSAAGPTPEPDLPPAKFEISLLVAGGVASAETAVQVALDRLATMTSTQTGHPFGELFAAWEGHTVPGQPVAVLEITFAPDVPAGMWTRLIFARDTPFLAW